MEDFPYIEFQGHKRLLSCVPSSPKAMAASPLYRDYNQVISKAAIIDWLKRHGGHYDLGMIGSPILDQKNVGACSSFSATSAFNLTWNISNQSSHVFSPWFQYAQINDGVDQGGTPHDNLSSLQNVGICLDSDNPSGIYFRDQLPSSCYTSAKRFRADKAYMIETEDSLNSAPMLNRPVEFGMALPHTFGHIDQSDGMPRKGGFLGLHAMMIRGLYLHPALQDIVYIVQNSWTTEFGIQDAIKFGWPHTDDLKGCCFIPPDMIFGGSYFEAFCLETATLDFNEQIPSVT
jgi:hypothetical protein